MKNILKKYKNNELSDDELSPEESYHIKKMLDTERATRWSQQLASQGVRKNQQPAQPKKLFVFIRPLMRVAAVLFVCAASWLFYINYSKQKTNPHELAYVLLEEPFHLTSANTRSNANDNDEKVATLRQKAYETYQQGKFDDAIRAMQAVVETTSQPNASDHFLMGLSYLQKTEKQANKALEHLLAAQRMGGSYKDEINLYLGITYTLLGDASRADAALKAVVESPSSREKLVQKAKELRQK